MKNRLLFVLLFTECLLFKISAVAQEDIFKPKIEWTGLVSLEEGQFIKCQYYLDPNGGVMPFRPWLTNVYARVGIKADLNPHFRLSIIPQVKLWNDTWDWANMNSSSAGNNPLNQHATISIVDAEGVFSFGSDAAKCNLAFGVMPYKYDQEAKNLGEYLFRTGEHPPYIQTSFDQAYVTLTGLRANAEILKNLSVDLLFTTETQVEPINDWSLSFLLGYTLPNYLSVGAGIMFDRLFPAAKILDQNGGAGGNTYMTSTGQVDSFSWGGTKVMAKLSFDPKGFLPSSVSRIFGKEDGKIYGEAAILGLKDIEAYKGYSDPNTGMPVPGKYVIDSANNFYSNISERIPIMFGFNVPTFKLLDYLSLEMEWYGWPYSRNIYNYENFKWILPKPTGPSTASDWKYSFNLKKTVWGHISIIGQIARDHTRHDVYYNGNTDVNEIFQLKDEWGWWAKLQYDL